jgi:hypothetical protein
MKVKAEVKVEAENAEFGMLNAELRRSEFLAHRST